MTLATAGKNHKTLIFINLRLKEFFKFPILKLKGGLPIVKINIFNNSTPFPKLKDWKFSLKEHLRIVKNAFFNKTNRLLSLRIGN